MKRNLFYKKEIKLTNSGKSLIDYIENNSEEFINCSIHDVAKKSFVSPSTISKTTRKLGFINFKKMQNWVSSQIVNSEESTLVNQPNKITDYISNVSKSYKLTIDRTVSDIDILQFEKIKKVIDNNVKIYTHGVGSSNLAAKQFSYALNILGKPSNNIKSFHNIFEFINGEEKNALVIFSKSLFTKEFNILRNIFEKHSIHLIIITANRSIKIRKNETVLFFRSLDQEERIIALSSKISELLIIDIFINWYGRPKENKVLKDFNLR